MGLNIHCIKPSVKEGIEITTKPSQFTFTETVAGYDFENSSSCPAGTYLIIFTALNNISVDGSATINARVSTGASIFLVGSSLDLETTTTGTATISQSFGDPTAYSFNAGKTVSFIFVINETLSSGKISGSISKI